MVKFSQEVMHAAAQTGCQAGVLDQQVIENLKARLIDKFTGGIKLSPMWEHFSQDSSIQAPDGWRWVREFAGGKAVIMFFDGDSDKTGIGFEDGGCLDAVLNECTGFEFYLTDFEASYILCFNHHDFLIGTGAAENWIKEKRTTISS